MGVEGLGVGVRVQGVETEKFKLGFQARVQKFSEEWGKWKERREGGP